MTDTARSTAVRVRAPGKLNVFFQVGAVQPDGYHDVASVYQAVSLYEEIRATHASGFSMTVRGSVDVSGVPADDRNLALRAARILATEIGYDGGVHLDAVKDVPVAGGMGGGSADAAAALVACDALWGAGLPPTALHALAARLGADVPFALMGGTAVGTGRGDELSPALATGRLDWVVVPAEGGLSTPAVYGHLDEMRARGDAAEAAEPAVAPEVLQALRAGDPRVLAAHVRNDLQQAALSLRPDLARVLDLGTEAGALAGMVSGSGPTLAFLAAGSEAALELQIVLSAAGLTALHVHGPVAGARVLSA
ncbi:4-(cytidine 5'-diphospho)-2-C-methyl-D-erythritol kinase [Microbacterium sp. NPDC077184]|uniref:4-(cytidine 5'-diphospho)-2-C-methyl-D-erythritol kinase n=1 Tax=Microbacterium sp. NPDC077184 TaxID=3154764 RepID=UPI0034252844